MPRSSLWLLRNSQLLTLRSAPNISIDLAVRIPDESGETFTNRQLATCSGALETMILRLVLGVMSPMR